MPVKASRAAESLILKGAPGSIFEQKSPLIRGNPHGLTLGHVHRELVFSMRAGRSGPDRDVQQHL